MEHVMPDPLIISKLLNALDNEDWDFIRDNMLRETDHRNLRVPFVCLTEGHFRLLAKMIELGLPKDTVLDTGESLMVLLMQCRHNVLNRTCQAEQIILCKGSINEDEITIDDTSSSLQVLQFLFVKGFLEYADHETFPDQVSPLHWSAREGCKHCTRQLLLWGCNINAAASDGCTPLIHGAYFGKIDCVKLLVEFGANLQVTSARNEWTRDHGNAGHNVLQYAENTYVCNRFNCYCDIQRRSFRQDCKRQTAEYLKSLPRPFSLSDLCRQSLLANEQFRHHIEEHLATVPMNVRRYLTFEASSLL